MAMKVEYDSNNSGGSWWLTDADWHALEAAGWEVQWVKDNPHSWKDTNGRWLGALATTATREGLTLREAISEWEKATGQSSNDLGCSCCGPPHDFSVRDENGNYVTGYSPEYPTQGDPY